MFAREHNRIATKLSALNPTWSDETVYQETRKVIIALFQHITYSEYVPLLLGTETARQLNLLPGVGTQQTSIYNPDTDPRVSNEVNNKLNVYSLT